MAPRPWRPRERKRRAAASHPAASWVPSAYFAEGIPFAMVIWVAGTMFKDLGHSDGADHDRHRQHRHRLVAQAAVGGVPRHVRRRRSSSSSAMEYAMAAVLVPDRARDAAAELLRARDRSGCGCWRSPRPRRTSASTASTSPRSTSSARPRGSACRAWPGTVGRIFATAVDRVGRRRRSRRQRLGARRRPGRTRCSSARSPWPRSRSITASCCRQGALVAAPAATRARSSTTFVDTLRDFFKKPQIWGMLLFVFLYRSGEGFLLVEAPLFLQAPLADGGAASRSRRRASSTARSAPSSASSAASPAARSSRSTGSSARCCSWRCA